MFPWNRSKATPMTRSGWWFGTFFTPFFHFRGFLIIPTDSYFSGGFFNHQPVMVLFDLEGWSSQVGTWDYCFLRRSKIPAARLKDLSHGGSVPDKWWLVDDSLRDYTTQYLGDYDITGGFLFFWLSLMGCCTWKRIGLTQKKIIPKKKSKKFKVPPF